MFALSARTMVLRPQRFVAVRSLSTATGSTVSPSATQANKATPAAGLSTTATNQASATSPNHVQHNGRVTSKNRTFHYSASWEGSDMPKAMTTSAKNEKARLSRMRNAMELC